MISCLWTNNFYSSNDIVDLLYFSFFQKRNSSHSTTLPYSCLLNAPRGGFVIDTPDTAIYWVFGAHFVLSFREKCLPHPLTVLQRILFKVIAVAYAGVEGLLYWLINRFSHRAVIITSNFGRKWSSWKAAIWCQKKKRAESERRGWEEGRREKKRTTPCLSQQLWGCWVYNLPCDAPKFRVLFAWINTWCMNVA